ncbi:TPM domain-containing protein [Chitinophagaceae bacterium LB-8]|uniref:TPM domain-containing protein n=1 Tax=Paraflavisolibacter caeni TaxID=2982496 RepID=A0A9X2XQ57_9BACT|nr:TPM domain-containing protein [Paraflavisolibacter caeni]MCU7552719.1 TPM domain-containing protein [Paraflavisolibacter caeni]
MKLFPWQNEKDFFTPEEKESILDAIRKAEQRTSGEVRLFIESRCRFVDALDRAKEIFFQLGMEKTMARNASLVYVAVKDRQVAVYGDEGIHQKVGQKYWEEEVNKMLVHFKQEHLADGIILSIQDIGEALHQHFPYDRDTDKNELPDEIIFGK